MWVFSGAPCRRDQHGVRGMSDLERRAEARDAGRRVAWVGVAAWDVGHDWMLASASAYLYT